MLFPPRDLIAPATPDPIQKASLAALTMASVAWAAMSSSTISMVSGGMLKEINFSSLALGPHPQRELTLMPRSGVAWPSLGMAAGAQRSLVWAASDLSI